MPSIQRVHPTEKSVGLANTLLTGGNRYQREGNVVTDLVFLLAEFGIDSAEIEREHPAGGGRIDVFLPRYFMIIEAKARGKAGDPEERPPGRGESPRAQLERYLEAETAAESYQSPGARPSSRSWTGIVTDGREWHVFTYPHVPNPIQWRKTLHTGTFPDGASALLESLGGWLAGDPSGRIWIPADPSHLFEGMADELSVLYSQMPDSARRATETKHALWHDMLRVSGMSPQGMAAPDRLFVTHSFLIAIARMVTHLTARLTDDYRSALRQGFVAWILDSPRGEAWAEGMWGIVSRYDWRRRRADVMRSLYEYFVPEADRKVFGEFYTSDWLAAMMVEQVLDGHWIKEAISAAEESMVTGAPLTGTGLLDPACGSGTFLYHAALRLLEAPAMCDLRPV